MKKTLIIGASTKPDRYSYKAAQKLLENNHPIVMIGNKADVLFDIDIKTSFDGLEQDIDTVTMYLSAKNQSQYYDKIINLKPQRVIFNPGTENEEFAAMLRENNIMVEIACTLVLLSTKSY